MMKLMRAPKGEGMASGKSLYPLDDEAVAERHVALLNQADPQFTYWLEPGPTNSIPENWFPTYTEQFVTLRKWDNATVYGYGATQAEAERCSEARPLEAWGPHTSLLVLERTDQVVERQGHSWAVYREVRFEG